MAIRKRRSLCCSLEKLRINESQACLVSIDTTVAYDNFLWQFKGRVRGWEENLNISSAVKNKTAEKGKMIICLKERRITCTNLVIFSIHKKASQKDLLKEMTNTY